MIVVDQPPRNRRVKGTRSRIRIPLWRRITAFFSLAFVSVLGGVVLAGVLGMAALLLLFLLERAIAT